MQVERNVPAPTAGAVGRGSSRVTWWRKIFHPVAAMAGLIVAGTDAKAAPVAAEGGEYRATTTVPEAWQVFAKQLQQRFEQQLAGDGEGGASYPGLSGAPRRKARCATFEAGASRLGSDRRQSQSHRGRWDGRCGGAGRAARAADGRRRRFTPAGNASTAALASVASDERAVAGGELADG